MNRQRASSIAILLTLVAAGTGAWLYPFFRDSIRIQSLSSKVTELPWPTDDGQQSLEGRLLDERTACLTLDRDLRWVILFSTPAKQMASYAFLSRSKRLRVDFVEQFDLVFPGDGERGNGEIRGLKFDFGDGVLNVGDRTHTYTEHPLVVWLREDGTLLGVEPLPTPASAAPASAPAGAQ